MAFVNEEISAQDIEKHHLPTPPNKGHYWTVDKERNMYLRGGAVGNPAIGEDIIWNFDLFIDGRLLVMKLGKGQGSVNFTENPYYVVWDNIIDINPNNLYEIDKNYIVAILKEALTAYGRNGRDNNYTPNIFTQFNF